MVYTSGAAATYDGPEFEHRHNTLGNLRGRQVTKSRFSEHPVVQFRSIPFAKIPARFRTAELHTNLPSDRARSFVDSGSACPQPSTRFPDFFDAYGGPLPGETGLTFDEFDCLTLSISAPKQHLESKAIAKLPVMVYIYGGGAAEGTGHVDGLHDTTTLCAFAESIGKPCVFVNIGYRVNYLGQLICDDLWQEYQSLPPQQQSTYGPFNQVLSDQKLGFEWIHKFIGGFGGDAENITAYGESAGSVFQVYHTFDDKPMFRRSVLQSGAIIGHADWKGKEAQYQLLLDHFHITGDTYKERLDKLRRVPAQELAEVAAPFPLMYVGPLSDGSPNPMFPRGTPTFTAQFDVLPSTPWLGDVLLGDTSFEGSLFLPLTQNLAPAVFLQRFLEIFPISALSAASAVLEAYGIAEGMKQNLFATRSAQLIGDVCFSQPMYALADALVKHNEPLSQGQRRHVYRYHVDMTNPVAKHGTALDGMRGHHFVDLLFLFLTLVDRYPDQPAIAGQQKWLQKQAFAMAERWILFASGEMPWSEYFSGGGGTDLTIAECDDEHGWHEQSMTQSEAQVEPLRRFEALDLAWKSLRWTEKAGKRTELNAEAWGNVVNTVRSKICVPGVPGALL
jgi:carboxylesterase type B